MATVSRFEDLECWKAARQVVRWVREVTRTFPRHETYDLIDNMRRAARSSTRNIAEGFGRHYHTENLQHCRISRGSLYEVLDDLITARDEGYVDEQQEETGRRLIMNAIQILNGYIRYLRSLKK